MDNKRTNILDPYPYEPRENLSKGAIWSRRAVLGLIVLACALCIALAASGQSMPW